MTGDHLPDSPLPMLAQGAIANHELFMVHVNAGFRRKEALKIMLTFLRHNLKNPPESG